jgi:hypothetical protein
LSTLFAVSLVATLATSAFASGQDDGPFTGSFTETFVPQTQPPILVASASGSGTVTRPKLGAATESFVGVVDFSAIDPRTQCAFDIANGSITFANGDKLFISSAGEFCQPSPPNGTGVDSGSFFITGGTGQLTSAFGGGKYTSTANLNDGTSSETYDGTIHVRGSGE